MALAARRGGGGLIPAHAGKTGDRLLGREHARAHPRSRGENKGQVEYRSAVTGSSPLTRGKRQPRPTAPHTVGLIPAHAGKTPILTGSQPSTKAHPRSRGENATVV